MSDPNLIETFHPETIIDNIQLTILQTLETIPAVKERKQQIIIITFLGYPPFLGHY